MTRWRISLHATGRLDIDTTGLVLMTDDGQWSHRITSPRAITVKKLLSTSGHQVGGRRYGSAICERRAVA